MFLYEPADIVRDDSESSSACPAANAVACAAIWLGAFHLKVEYCAPRMEESSRMMAHPRGRPVQNVDDYGIEDMRVASWSRAHHLSAESALLAEVAEAEI